METERVSYIGEVADIQQYLPWGRCYLIEGIRLEIEVCSVIQRLERILGLANAAIK